jgi:hypothetical protein
MAKSQAVLMEFLTQLGTRKQIRIPLRLLATDGAEVIRRLKAAGLCIAPGADDLVLTYITDQISRCGSDALQSDIDPWSVESHPSLEHD